MYAGGNYLSWYKEQVLVCVVHAVGSAFIISAMLGTVVSGNVQSWGLYWGSVGSDLCVTCAVKCAASSVLGLTVRGRHPSYWQKTVKKVYNFAIKFRLNA